MSINVLKSVCSGSSLLNDKNKYWTKGDQLCILQVSEEVFKSSLIMKTMPYDLSECVSSSAISWRE
jgi:hypothetical protein